MESVFNILNDDLTDKIINIRIDDIEKSISILENKMLLSSHLLKELDIDKMDKRYWNNEYNFNNRYSILFNDLVYSSEIYLYNTIYYGNVIFVFIQTTAEDDFITILSEEIRNPTMLQLCSFSKDYIGTDYTITIARDWVFIPRSCYDKYGLILNNNIEYIELSLAH
jgi:hypothetical protein